MKVFPALPTVYDVMYARVVDMKDTLTGTTSAETFTTYAEADKKYREICADPYVSHARLVGPLDTQEFIAFRDRAYEQNSDLREWYIAHGIPSELVR